MYMRPIAIVVCMVLAGAAGAQDSGCLIISEVVAGALSGDCPNWVEITNTGTLPFTFSQGGLIVQVDNKTDVFVDVPLPGVTIAPGQSFVVCSNSGCSGSFFGIYGFHADFYTNVPIGNGNDRYILTDTADGSHLIDIYGQFGVNGSGQPWEYTHGYSYRLPPYNSGTGQTFAAEEWFYGGVGSLEVEDYMYPMLTSPKAHVYNEICGCDPQHPRGDANCDGNVDGFDIQPFVLALTDPAAWIASYPNCQIGCVCDASCDGAIDGFDIQPFVTCLTQGCPPCP